MSDAQVCAPPRRFMSAHTGATYGGDGSVATFRNHPTGDVMRAEMQALADKIEQSLVLLRRHL